MNGILIWRGILVLGVLLVFQAEGFAEEFRKETKLPVVFQAESNGNEIKILIDKATVRIGPGTKFEIEVGGCVFHESGKSIFVEKIEKRHLEVDSLVVVSEDGKRFEVPVSYQANSQGVFKNYFLIPGRESKGRGPVYFREKILASDLSRHMFAASKYVFEFDVKIEFFYHVVGGEGIKTASAILPIRISGSDED